MKDERAQNELWKAHQDQTKRMTPGESWGRSHLQDDSTSSEITSTQSRTNMSKFADEKSYEKNSEILQCKIYDNLKLHGLLHDDDIQVFVAGEEVTLTGVVSNNIDISAIETSVTEVDGVEKVVNKLSKNSDKS